jgi:hypothetical protein
MNGMTSTPSYEVNQLIIIALGRRGNKLEIIAQGLSGWSGSSGFSGSTK